MQGLSPAGETLARWAASLRPAAVPPEVRAAAQLHLVDTLGVSLAAHSLGEMPAASALVREYGGAAQATAIGIPDRVPAPSAALVNGTLAHALDFDDTHETGHVHASAVVGSAALAAAEAVGAGGVDLLTAVVAGFEVATRVGMATGGRLQPRGFHPTSICGIFGAATAAAVLRGLDPEGVRNALGIAGSQAAGLFEFLADGSQTKPLHAGFAAQAGVIAATLASYGATGPATVLEGRFGLLRSHLDEFDATELTAGLGERWETSNLVFKPYPTCHCCHTPLDALAGILANEHLEPDDIESIVCRVPAIAVPMVLEPGERKRAPSTPYEAKFSLPFCLATLLVHGDAGIERFTRDAIRHPGILALASRVGYVVEEFPGGNQLSGGVEVTTRDGRRLTAEVLHPRGGQANPVSAEDVERKFVSNAGLALGPDNAAALLDGLLRLGERPAAETGALLGRATGLVPA